jgi:hypothetical protein
MCPLKTNFFQFSNQQQITILIKNCLLIDDPPLGVLEKRECLLDSKLPYGANHYFHLPLVRTIYKIKI